MKKYLVACLFVFAFWGGLKGQINQESVIQQIIENMAEAGVELENTEQIFEELQYLLKYPLNINAASRFDLEKMFFLSDNQIDELLIFVKESGELSSVYQLQALKSFSVTELMLLANFITVESVSEDNQAKYLNGEILIKDAFDIETAKGFDSDGGYLGDKNQLTSKLRLSYGRHISAGAVVDKDPGERFFRDSLRFDFASAYLMYEGKGLLKRLVLGDYKVEIGEGLGMNTGFNMGKSTLTTHVSLKNTGINKYSSAGESGFFRGIGFKLGKDFWTVNVFSSYRKLDGDVVQDTISGTKIAYSFPSTGYHRTQSELEKKQTVDQFVVGGNLDLRVNSLQLYGGAYFEKKDIDSIVNNYSYRLGNWIKPQSSHGWFGYKYGFNRGLFFGEISGNSIDNLSFINGLRYNPTGNVSLALLYRRFSGNWFSEFANPFSEFSDPSGESGLYLGFNILPVKNVDLSGYFDAFDVSKIKYGISQPSDGYDAMLKVLYHVNSRIETYLLYKEKEKGVNSGYSESVIYKVVNSNTKRLRWHASYVLSDSWELQTRIERSFYKEDFSSRLEGELLYADLRYKTSTSKFGCSVRYLMFDVADYAARIYTYENDVLYNFYVPSFQGKGSRVYFNVKVSFAKNMNFWIKVGRTINSDKKEIGSGLQAIKGNARTNLKMQFQYKF